MKDENFSKSESNEIIETIENKTEEREMENKKAPYRQSVTFILVNKLNKVSLIITNN